MSAQKNDNRMSWIRNAEKLSASPDGGYYCEYEFVSECRITGLLDYENGKLICGLFTLEEDRNGLYHYLLRIQYPKFEGGYNEKADKKGYYFKDGIIGELLSLFSLYFQCRFYIVAIYQGELTNRSIKIKMEQEFSYKKIPKGIHPKIFSEDNKNFAVGLSDFLDSVRKLDSQKHQRFILACHHYARSLKEVGRDSEMVFIRLVSAIEILSGAYKLRKKDNPLNGEKFSVMFNDTSLTKEQAKQLKEILKVNGQGKIQIGKSKQKFINFVKAHSTGCLKGGNWKAKHVRITRQNLPDVLTTIYDARSRYLHSGEPMYLSQFMHGAGKWDTDPSLGMMIDNRKFPSAHKLPYTYWFENLVRHCLLNYLKSNLPK